MTTRQYIGARYIPVFADPVQWSVDREYDYLTMVQYQGETYMSKQYVPANISLPDTAHGEEDNEYWVHMSNWNAQIEVYREEVLQYNNRISTVEDDLPIASFDSTNTVKKAIDDAVALLPGTSFDSTNTVKKAIDDNADLLPASSFDSTNTVKKAIDDAVDLLPGTSFDSTNTVKKAIDSIAELACETNNPIYYGADPNGVEDSTQAINDCIEANKGGVVIFTPGTYLLTDSIETPYDSAYRVSIDFNGSVLKCQNSTSMNALLKIGYTNKTTTESNSYTQRNFYRNFTIINENANVNWAVMVNNHYMNAFIDNFYISTDSNGISISEKDSTNYPSDCLITNGLIWSRNNVLDRIGIGIYGTDNKFQNLRVYDFNVFFAVNKGGNVFDNIHTLGINDLTSQIGTSFNVEAKHNRFNLLYNDTVKTVFKLNTGSGIEVFNAFDYSYNSSLDGRIFVDGYSGKNIDITIDGLDIFAYDTTNKYRTVLLPDSGEYGEKTISRLKISNITTNADGKGDSLFLVNDFSRAVLSSNTYQSTANSWNEVGTVIGNNAKFVTLLINVGTLFGVCRVVSNGTAVIGDLIGGSGTIQVGVEPLTNALTTGNVKSCRVLVKTSLTDPIIVKEIGSQSGTRFLQNYYTTVDAVTDPNTPSTTASLS